MQDSIIGIRKKEKEVQKKGVRLTYSGPSFVGNKRETSLHDRFFAFSETAIIPVTALRANRDVSSVSLIS